MSDKMNKEQVEAMLKLTLLQRQALAQQLADIENDSSLTPDDKFQRLAELLNPVKGV